MTGNLSAILEGHRGRRILGGDGVWRLVGSGAAVIECRRELLAEFIRNGTAILVFDEQPGDEIERWVKPAGKNRWALSRHTKPSAIEGWLMVGNWQAWIGGTTDGALPDLCRMSDSEVRTALRKRGAQAAIDSFHDNQTWTVAFAARPSSVCPS